MDRALIGAPIDRSARAVGVFVPLNFRLSDPELAWNIGDASIHTLVAGEEHVPVIYTLPRELRLVDALPRNPTRKLLKARLRTPAKEGA